MFVFHRPLHKPEVNIHVTHLCCLRLVVGDSIQQKLPAAKSLQQKSSISVGIRGYVSKRTTRLSIVAVDHAVSAAARPLSAGFFSLLLFKLEQNSGERHKITSKLWPNPGSSSILFFTVSSLPA